MVFQPFDRDFVFYLLNDTAIFLIEASTKQRLKNSLFPYTLKFLRDNDLKKSIYPSTLKLLRNGGLKKSLSPSTLKFDETAV